MGTCRTSCSGRSRRCHRGVRPCGCAGRSPREAVTQEIWPGSSYLATCMAQSFRTPRPAHSPPSSPARSRERSRRRLSSTLPQPRCPCLAFRSTSAAGCHTPPRHGRRRSSTRCPARCCCAASASDSLAAEMAGSSEAVFSSASGGPCRSCATRTRPAHSTACTC